MIILLDLNFTLVANSEQKIKPFTNQIVREAYRLDLLERIKKDRVILVTARPEVHKPQTLGSIMSKTGWQPEDSYFNHGLMPPAFKSYAFEKFIAPKYGVDPELYLAIESNPRTRAMYQKKGIKAITYKDFMEGANDR